MKNEIFFNVRQKLLYLLFSFIIVISEFFLLNMRKKMHLNALFISFVLLINKKMKEDMANTHTHKKKP